MSKALYISQFGNYIFPADQLGMTETQGGDRSPSTLQLPGLDGALDLNGTGADTFDVDRISKRVYLEAATPAALQDAIDALAGNMQYSQILSSQGSRLLIATLPDGSQRATWAKCTACRWTMETVNIENAWLGPVDITWQRTGPQWWTYTDGPLFLGDHLGTLADTDSGGLTLGEGVVTLTPLADFINVNFTVTNSGNAPISHGLFEVDYGDTFTLTNLRNGYAFTWARPSSGWTGQERVSVDFASFSVKRDGANDWPAVTLGVKNKDNRMMVFEPGANPMRLAKTDIGTITIRYYLSDAWV